MDEKEIEIEKVDEEGPEIIHEGEEGYEVKQDTSSELDSDEESHDEPDVGISDVENKPRKSRVPAKTRINQVTRKFHEESRRAEKAERELMAMREEMERLKRQSESSNKAMLTSQESMLDTHIRNAEQIYAKAMEDGDIQAQIEANKAIAAATADKRRLDEIKYQQKLMEEEQKYVESKPKTQNSNYEIPAPPEAVEWLDENPWFNEESDDFDPDLHQKAMAYAQHLDLRYVRNGKQDRIMSHEYFDDINRYMSKHTNQNIAPQRQTNSNPKGDLVMNRPRATVSGVGHTPMQGGRETFRMSREEQDMARAMGWSDQQWFHYKKEADKLEKADRLRSAFGNSR